MQEPDGNKVINVSVDMIKDVMITDEEVEDENISFLNESHLE